MTTSAISAATVWPWLTKTSIGRGTAGRAPRLDDSGVAIETGADPNTIEAAVLQDQRDPERQDQLRVVTFASSALPRMPVTRLTRASARG